MDRLDIPPIFRPQRIGAVSIDTTLSTPALDRFRAEFPGAFLATLAIDGEVAAVARRSLFVCALGSDTERCERVKSILSADRLPPICLILDPCSIVDGVSRLIAWTALGRHEITAWVAPKFHPHHGVAP
jgi:hypothetical protein